MCRLRKWKNAEPSREFRADAFSWKFDSLNLSSHSSLRCVYSMVRICVRISEKSKFIGARVGINSSACVRTDEISSKIVSKARLCESADEWKFVRCKFGTRCWPSPVITQLNIRIGQVVELPSCVMAVHFFVANVQTRSIFNNFCPSSSRDVSYTCQNFSPVVD